MVKTYFKNLALLLALAACFLSVEMLQQGAIKHANKEFAKLPLSKAVFDSHYKANASAVSDQEMERFSLSSKALAQEHTRVFWFAVAVRIALVLVFSWLLVLVHRRPNNSFKGTPTGAELAPL